MPQGCAAFLYQIDKLIQLKIELYARTQDLIISESEDAH